MKTDEKVTQISINHILLRVNPHWDEIVAVWILMMYGNGRYTGIGNSKIRYTNGVEPKGDTIFDLMKMLPVGCGHGRYDEHRAGIERLPGECATTLVCKDLDLMHMPVIRRIAEEALRCDTQTGVQVAEMPSVIKAMHRRLPEGSETVREWATKGLRAINSTLDLNLSRMPGEKSLKEIFAELDKEGRFPEKKSRDSLASVVGKSQGRVEKAKRESSPMPFLELAFVVMALQRTDIVPSSDILDWAMFALDHLYTDQTEFWKAVEEAKTPRTGRVAERILDATGGKERAGVTVLLIHSDSSLVSRASRMREVCGGFDVTVVRNSRGQVHVSVDAGTNLNLGNLIRMLRWVELPKDEEGKPVTKVSWSELGQEGHHPEIPHIYYFKKGNSILNGSTTHPDAAPIRMCSQALLETVLCAFDSQRTIGWMRDRKIFGGNKPLNNVGEAVKSAEASAAEDENPPAADKKAA